MNIRPAVLSDIPAIADIEKECFSAPWSEEALASELANGQTVMLAAESDGGIKGYVSMRYVLDEGYINNVAVSPCFRRRGTARALLCALEDTGREKGLKFLTLEVRESNAAARALYESLGYEQTGRRRGFYRIPREDAQLYTKFL